MTRRRSIADSVTTTGGGSSVSVDADTILENLEMTFMGSFEASNGTWGGYLNCEMKSGKAIEDINFNGPGIAAVFRW